MKTIDMHMLANVSGGAPLGTLTASTGAPAKRPSSSSSSSSMQTALTGITSALDSLKQNGNKNGSLEQLLPLVVMAKWMRNR